MNEIIVRTYQEGLEALSMMARAHEYLANQFSLTMPRDEAQAHFDARALLLNRRMALLDEMELEYTYGSGQYKPE